MPHKRDLIAKELGERWSNYIRGDLSGRPPISDKEGIWILESALEHLYEVLDDYGSQIGSRMVDCEEIPHVLMQRYNQIISSIKTLEDHMEDMNSPQTK